MDDMFTCSGTTAIPGGLTTVTVTVRRLECNVIYDIIAGGLEMVGGDLIGPRSSHGTAMGPCAPMTTTIVPTTSITGKLDVIYRASYNVLCNYL